MSIHPTANVLEKDILAAFSKAQLSDARESRVDAIACFEKAGLPGNKSEEYRFTSITRNLEKNFTGSHFAEETPSTINKVDDRLIPGYESNLVVIVNGQYSEKLSRIISPKEQLTVQSLKQALEEKSELVWKHFTKLVAPASDAFAALNTAFWQDGIFIHVPKDTAVETPVFILHFNDASQQPVISQSRLLMVMEEGSQATITEKTDSTGDHAVFNNRVDEIAVGTRAVLNYTKIQNDPGALYQVVNTVIQQDADSRVNTFTITLNGQVVRNNLGIVIDGEKCESHFYGLYLLHQRTLADNHTVVDHRKPNSFSNELYKGIMDGNSKGVFNGKIYVRPHAQKTNAFQSNRNILLSDGATINTKPQLEIWADDVKCSHGCTSGQLDEEAMFYLQSRGISKTSAQAMLLYAFAGEVLDPLKDESLKNYLDHLISERLQKNLQ